MDGAALAEIPIVEHVREKTSYTTRPTVAGAAPVGLR
jgi:hypothetical protein